MERLLVLKLQAQGCEAQAWLNGVPIAHVTAAHPQVVIPIHEYAIAGNNRVELIIWPRPAATASAPALPSEPRISDGMLGASVRILLPRSGNPADEASARTLAQQDWAPSDGSAYEVPLTRAFEMPLPVSFPRWRWLDAPPVEASVALRLQALAFVQRIALDLSRGEVDSFLAATRLRTEELALAYQRNPVDELARLKAHLLALYAAKNFHCLPLLADNFALRRIADGRLLECLDAAGLPALRTAPDAQGKCWAFPLRLAAVEGKLYVLR